MRLAESPCLGRLWAGEGGRGSGLNPFLGLTKSLEACFVRALLYGILFIFSSIFYKSVVSSRILQNYTIAVMWYGVWAQTSYHTTFVNPGAGIVAHANAVWYDGRVHKRRVI
jgi:hypothetical protein